MGIGERHAVEGKEKLLKLVSGRKWKGPLGWAGILVLPLVLLIMGGLAESRADTIVAVSGSQTMSPGTPADELELEELGIDPHLFLFTGNTMYGNNGITQLDIVADNVDPSSALSLNDSATHTLITLDDSGNVVGVTGSSSNSISGSVQVQSPSTTPEPATGLLCVTGLLLLAGGLLRAAKAQALSAAPVLNRDP